MRTAIGGSTRVKRSAKSKLMRPGKVKRPKAYPASVAITVAANAAGSETIMLLRKPRPICFVCPPKIASSSAWPRMRS